jgi:hypothetical protein
MFFELVIFSSGIIISTLFTNFIYNHINIKYCQENYKKLIVLNKDG